VAKRAVRLSERRARHADPCNASAATAARNERRRQYRDLLKKKRENFWPWKLIARHRGNSGVPSIS